MILRWVLSLHLKVFSTENLCSVDNSSKIPGNINTTRSHNTWTVITQPVHHAKMLSESIEMNKWIKQIKLIGSQQWHDYRPPSSCKKYKKINKYNL